MVERQHTTKKVTVVALLSAVAGILMFLEFPIPFLIPSFVKMDLSELPALLASFAYGPVAGVAVCLIKNLVKLVSTASGGVGELCNFALGICFVLPAGWIYRKHRTKKGAVIGSAVGVLLMAAASFPINLFISYPIYTKIYPLETILSLYRKLLPFVKTLPQCLLLFNVPFTLLKGALDTLLVFLIYPRVRKLLH